MAGTRYLNAISFLSLASAAVAAPLTSKTGANIFNQRADDICKSTSECVPFTVDVKWGSVDATGAGSRGAILTNGSLPGPALRLKVGECVDFKVINNLEVNTGMHFHGIQMTDTPWSDGVPGVTQHPIKPGEKYMYRWTADEQGSYFYHSHYKGQLMDGMYGAIFVSPADDEESPFSLIDSSAVDKLKLADSKNEPLFVSDWSQYTFDDYWAIEQAGNVDIACADAIVINGIGSQYCLTKDQITAMTPPQIINITNGAGYSKKGCIPANTPRTQGNYTRNLAAIPPNVYDVCTPSSGKNYTLKVDQADGWAAITFINPGAFSQLKTTIDNHKLWVYNLNGQYIQPQQVDQVAIGNGERVSCFIKLDQQVGDYQIRVSNVGLNQIISGFGVLSYKGSVGISSTSDPLMTFGGAPIAGKTIVPLTIKKAAPFPAQPVSKTVDKTYKFKLQKLPNSPDAYRWSLQGNTAYDMANDDGTPLLSKDPSSIPESDVIKKNKMGEWIDIIMETTGPLAQPHPIHKHANKVFVIGTGTGSFNWSSVAEAYAVNATAFNLENPPYVDGFTTIPGEGMSTWTVFRYKVEIAGAWLFHCHMQSHMSGGMALAFLDGVDKWPSVPSDAGKVCQGTGSSNSTWNPSCFCPASCPGNPGMIDGTSSTDTGSPTGSSSGSDHAGTSTGSDSGSWDNGQWNGANNLATSDVPAENPNSGTGSYGAGLSNTTDTTSSKGDGIKPFTGAASGFSVSIFSVLTLAIAASSL